VARQIHHSVVGQHAIGGDDVVRVLTGEVVAPPVPVVRVLAGIDEEVLFPAEQRQ
jgi:hypothetical protein